MRIGITYDLKGDAPPPPGAPDDFQEEFDSPVTVEAVAGVLRGLGHEVVKLGDGREMLQRLLTDPPDFVFNFAEGQGVSRSGRKGCASGTASKVHSSVHGPGSTSAPRMLSSSRRASSSKRVTK